MRQFSTCTVDPEVKLTPLRPRVVPAPLIERFLNLTTIVFGVSVALSFTITKLTPDARIAPKPAPVQPSRTIDLVEVTAPKPPGSSASISPPEAVLEIAPAQVLQGAVRLQGLTSSPTPETQVRVACAWVDDAVKKTNINKPKVTKVNRILLILSSP